MIANNSGNEHNKGLMPNDKQQNDKEQQQRTQQELDTHLSMQCIIFPRGTMQATIQSVPTYEYIGLYWNILGHHAGHHPIGAHLKEHT